MSILVRYYPANMTADQYDKANEQIMGSSEWPPDGLELHVCFGSDGELKVSEVWQSQEQLQAFGERLMPMLDQHGITFESEPEIIPVHNVEKL